MKLPFRKQKKHKGFFVARLRYVLLWIITTVFYVFYQNYITFYCFVLITSLPILSRYLLSAGWKDTKISLKFSQDVYRLEDEGRLILQYHGKWYPFAICQMKGTMLNEFYHQDHPTSFVFFMAPNTNIQQNFVCERCGAYSVSFQELELFDVLGLWKKRIPISLEAQSAVYPNPFRSSAIEQMVESGNEREKETLRKGNLEYSDTYDIRAYREGDSLKHMHHKVSFKLQKVMMKEFANLEQTKLYFYLDFSGEDEEIEQTLALCYSVVLAFVNKQQSVICCWSKEEGMQSFEVEVPSQIRKLFDQIYHSNVSFQTNQAGQIDGVGYRLKGYELKEFSHGEALYGTK